MDYAAPTRVALALGCLTGGDDHLYIDGSPAIATTSALAATMTSAPCGTLAAATTSG
jgi:hypothetical protein